jgi:hypothetical protein
MMEALVWPQQPHYKKATAEVSESIEIPGQHVIRRRGNGRSFRPGVRAKENVKENVKENAGHRGTRIETELR